MSSFKNAGRAHKERAQPASRKKFGLLEKHKDYVVRAKAFHQKEETIRKLKEKAEFRNPDEFNFKMIRSKVVDGVHRSKNDGNTYTHEELVLMKTQDKGYVLSKIQSERKKIEKLTASLHLIGHKRNSHTYYAENKQEAKEIKLQIMARKNVESSNVSDEIKRRTAESYRELEERKNRLSQLERIHHDMVMQQELQKKGRKRKLREDEIVNPTSRPVYKWRFERKR